MFAYEFPVIYNIHDVLPHIEGRDEFRVFPKDGYTVVNYMVNLPETFQWDESDALGCVMRRECRGLIFDTETGVLISRPYHKFFNVGERDETQSNKINLYEPHVILQKLDGSMIRPIPTAHGFRLATKAGITDTAMRAEVFIADKPQYAEAIKTFMNLGFTPIFEWCSRKDRIVIDYPDDNLILTGLRNTMDGEYTCHEAMVNYFRVWDIPVVRAIDGLADQNIELFINQIREWENDEGVVGRYDNGHMFKVKADDYVLRHKSKDAISQEKNVIAIIVNDQVDDTLPLLTPEDAKRVQEFQELFWGKLEDVVYEMADIFISGHIDYPDKKDFAVEFVQKKVPRRYTSFMYGMKAGKKPRELVIEKIQGSVGTATNVEKVRWLFGGLKWN